MLLFISTETSTKRRYGNFNTSHVTVYLPFLISKLFFLIHFNTSHVTVYQKANLHARMASAFQYIPCYCLSIKFYGIVSQTCEFQYIPCYCLSSWLELITFNSLKFQYIPCYCLSFIEEHSRKRNTYFNTSHVTVYHTIALDKKIICWDFNTSHVTVYPTNPTGSNPSCLYFNTSHVTVYLQSQHQQESPTWISIHPMLLFIQAVLTFMGQYQNFNTSHVTVYQYQKCKKCWR